MGKRVGGQGLVVFAQHTTSPIRQFAVKFFLSSDAFEVERDAARNPVRHLPLCAQLLPLR